MVAALVAHAERADAGDDMALAQGQIMRTVIQQSVAAALRFQSERKSRITGDIDALDRIHLDCDGERHGRRSIDAARHRLERKRLFFVKGFADACCLYATRERSA